MSGDESKYHHDELQYPTYEIMIDHIIRQIENGRSDPILPRLYYLDVTYLRNQLAAAERRAGVLDIALRRAVKCGDPTAQQEPLVSFYISEAEAAYDTEHAGEGKSDG